MSAQAGTAIDDFGGLIDWSGLNAWIAGRQLPGAGADMALSSTAMRPRQPKASSNR